MPQFTDTKGLAWPVEITVATLKRVKNLAGIDLLKILDTKSRLFVRLQDDPVLLVDVLYAIIQPAAAERGVTDEQFGQSLSGEVLDAACKAFLEAIADFFPKPQQRAALRKLVEKTGRLHERLMEHGLGELDAFNVEAIPLADLVAGGVAATAEAVPATA